MKWRIGMTHRRASTQRCDPNDPITLMVGRMLGQKKRVKARSGAQQYQRDAYAASGMEAVVEAEFANRPDKSVMKVPLNLRQRVAKEFFARLPKEQQDAWVAKAKKEADAERSRSLGISSSPQMENPAMIAT